MASASAQSIAPGGSESVEVEYTSPPSNQDDSRKVGIQFAESDAPMLWLEVQARIRQPLSFFPESLTLNQIGRDGAEDFFEIYNYTTKPVQLDPLRCSEGWLETTITDVEAKIPGLIQIWRVVVRARIAGLKPGRHRGEVLVTAKETGLKKAVAINLELVAPIRPIPSRLFFGSMDQRKSVDRKVLLLLSSDLTRLTLENLEIEHDLGDRLGVSCTRKSPTEIELVATLTPGKVGLTDVNGTIRIAFRNELLPPISLPVIATVQP